MGNGAQTRKAAKSYVVLGRGPVTWQNDTRTAAPGESVDDLNPTSISWLVEQGYVAEAGSAEAEEFLASLKAEDPPAPPGSSDDSPPPNGLDTGGLLTPPSSPEASNETAQAERVLPPFGGVAPPASDEEE